MAEGKVPLMFGGSPQAMLAAMFAPLATQPQDPLFPNGFGGGVLGAGRPVPEFMAQQGATAKQAYGDILKRTGNEQLARAVYARNVAGKPSLDNPLLGWGPADIGAGSAMMGAIKAYHGSPHVFDKFSMSKIGTGEGAQAYGHGLYFAENAGTAKAYRDDLTGSMIAGANRALRKAGGDVDAAISSVKAEIERLKALPNAGNDAAKRDQFIALNEEKLVELNRLKSTGSMSKGSLYEVELSPNKEDLLDWDKPLSEQPKKVQEALAGLIDQMPQDGKNGPIRRAIESIRNGTATAADLYNRLAHSGGSFSPAAATEALRKAGIPGIKYLDQGSRSGGGGTHNFVMFDDSHVKITGRK